MNDKLLFAVGTLLSWAGWGCAFRFAFLGISLAAKSPGLDAKKAQRGLILSGILGAVLLLVGLAMPGVRDGKELKFPLVWFAMPFLAWAVLVSGVVAISRLVQAWLAMNAQERSQRLRAAGIWAVATAVVLFLYLRDSENKIEIIKGGIPLSLGTAVAIILLALASMAAMIYVGRATAGRGMVKAVVIQITLIAGSVVFGLPFAFLLITSFKEDRDMSSPNGIVWVPKVQQTMKYIDKKFPLYEASYQGETVQVNLIEMNTDGTAQADIQRPMALRGQTFKAKMDAFKLVPKDVPIVTVKMDGSVVKGIVIEEMEDGQRRVSVLEPASLKGKEAIYPPAEVTPVREVGLRFQNYPEALEYLPIETHNGLVYLQNTLILVVLTVIGTILSSSIVAYAFSRMVFPGRDVLFSILLSTMMLPGAVTLLPQFLIWRTLHGVDTLYPLWVPAFFGSAFTIFLLRQFFKQVPMELEDAAKIDGCTYIRTFWQIMMPQTKAAIAFIAVTTFMGTWNNFMGPLIYINSPEHMPLSYGLQLFMGDRGGEPGLLMAFATMTIIPVLALFFASQKYIVEGNALTGLGGR